MTWLLKVRKKEKHLFRRFAIETFFVIKWECLSLEAKGKKSPGSILLAKLKKKSDS